MRFKLYLLGYICFFLSFAGNYEEKKKVIEKSYPVTDATTFQVENKFGKVHVNTWTKKEVSVKVEIIAQGKNADKAQKLLDQIEIDIDQSSTLIAFTTDIRGNMNTRGDESFEINYTVSLPAKNKVRIENSFGDTYLAEREGPVDLEVSYGSLKTESIKGDLELILSFGDGVVGASNRSNIEVKYSNLELYNAKIMKMEAQFSDVELASVEELELESKYGELSVGRANSINADAQFSGFRVEELTNTLYLEASYVSDFEIRKLAKSFTKVEIYGKFSNYELRLEDGLKADLEAEFSFSKMVSDGPNIDIYYQVKGDNKNEYKARIRGGDPTKLIKVKSSYGDLRIR